MARADRAIDRYELAEVYTMTVHIALAPMLALAAGITILVAPRFLNYVVAFYLIIIGVLGLLHW